MTGYEPTNIVGLLELISTIFAQQSHHRTSSNSQMVFCSPQTGLSFHLARVKRKNDPNR